MVARFSHRRTYRAGFGRGDKQRYDPEDIALTRFCPLQLFPAPSPPSRPDRRKLWDSRLVATAEEDRRNVYSLTRRSQSRCRVMFPDKARLRRLLPRLQTKSKLSLPSR